VFAPAFPLYHPTGRTSSRAARVQSPDRGRLCVRLRGRRHEAAPGESGPLSYGSGRPAHGPRRCPAELRLRRLPERAVGRCGSEHGGGSIYAALRSGAMESMRSGWRRGSKWASRTDGESAMSIRALRGYRSPQQHGALSQGEPPGLERLPAPCSASSCCLYPHEGSSRKYRGSAPARSRSWGQTQELIALPLRFRGSPHPPS
jgi:hypothetical protein